MTTICRIFLLFFFSATTALAQWTVLTPSNSPLRSNTVRQVALAADGSKWIATPQAVQRLKGTTWTTYSAANGPAFTNVRCVAAANGLVWVGSEQGLSCFDGTSWLTFNSPLQLPTGYYGPNDFTISDIVVAKNGAVWLAGSKGIARFDGTTSTKFTINTFLQSDAVTSLALDEATNTLWIGANCTNSTSGVYGFNYLANTWRYFSLPSNNCVHGVAVNAGGTVFVGSCNTSGLLAIRNGVAGPATASSCVAVDGLAIDPTNPQRVWVATESAGPGGTQPKGLLVYNGAAVVRQLNTATSGLPSNFVSSVALEAAGGRLRAWVGTADQGLAVYEEAALATQSAQPRVAVQVLSNPATASVEISTDLTRYQLAVYDNAGRLLHIQAVTQAGPVRLPVQAWAGGLYHVRLTSEQSSGYARFSKE